MDKLDKSVKYWAVSMTIFESENKKYISCTHRYIDKYKLPSVRRWYFVDEETAKTCSKMLRMIDLNPAYKKSFNDLVGKEAVFVDKGLDMKNFKDN